MACHELPSAAQDHQAVDDVRRRAVALAGQMTDWLSARLPVETPCDGSDPDLVEWCRSARDVLEAVARG